MKVLLINDTRKDEHFGCSTVMNNLEALLKKCGYEIAYTYPLGSDWENDAGLAEAVRSAQCIVVNGEGSIHHSNARAISLANVGPFAKDVANIPAILLNATLYANDDELYEKLSSYACLNVRDSYSRKKLQSKGVQSTQTPDMTFYIPFMAASEVKGKVKGFFAKFFVKKHKDYAVTDSARPSITRVIRRAAKKNGWDEISMYNPKEEKGQVYINLLHRYKMLLTGRFHTACFCIHTGVPFVAVESNTNKITSLLLDVFGNTKRLLEAEKLSNLRVEEWETFSLDELQAIEQYKQRSKGQFIELEAALLQLKEQAVSFGNYEAVKAWQQKRG